MKRGLKQHFFSGSSIYHRVFLIFFVICLLIAGFSYQYYRSLASTMEEESELYLQEISRRIADNVDRIVSDNYDVLHTMATSLEHLKIDDLETAKSLLQSQAQELGFDDVFLINTTGTAYNLSNTQTFLNLDKEVRKALLDGADSMSLAQVIQNQEYILFSVPLSDVTIDGIPVVALAASYAPSSFDKALSMTSFNDQSYSQIVTTDGVIVVRSSSPHAIKSGYNIFSTLKNAEIIGAQDFDTMVHDLKDHTSGQISYTLNGDETYMVYTPIGADNWYLLSFIPVDVVSERSHLLLRSTLLICGLIAIAFAGLCAALVYIFNNHKRKLEQIAYVDEVTDGHTIQRFYELAQSLISSHRNTRYALIYTNIVKFKVLNDEIGRNNCDNILRFFSTYISNKIAPNELIARQSADNFCMLMVIEDETALLDKFGQWRMEAEQLVSQAQVQWSLPIMEFGIFVIVNDTLTFPQMIDRAKLALSETPRTVDSKLRCAFYNDEVRRQLLREKQLEDRTEHALLNGEFTVFLQPKYRMPDERIGGAEALVRWRSSEEGMIYPDEFIPLFEKNGFIITLDLFVFEQVCITLRRWIDSGIPPIRISVNCSRLHFKDNNFLQSYINVADQYNIDHSLIEIEVTESMVLEDSNRLIQIIRSIKAGGFQCSMDDFGSGYSSLNLIQTIPVDVLKLDKIFFQTKCVDIARTQAVVTNIISMAKALSMQTVAEGVEEREQADMLTSAGIDFIQGYVFARPMDIPAFETLMLKENERN